MIVLTLPFPPSLNGMYKNRSRGRAKSSRYMTWANAAGWQLKAQQQNPIRGWYTLTLILNEPDYRRRDPDNFIKPVSDLLVTHGLIEDDHLCSELQVHRQKALQAGCEVIVRSSSGRRQQQ